MKQRLELDNWPSLQLSWLERRTRIAGSILVRGSISNKCIKFILKFFIQKTRLQVVELGRRELEETKKLSFQQLLLSIKQGWESLLIDFDHIYLSGITVFTSRQNRERPSEVQVTKHELHSHVRRHYISRKNVANKIRPQQACRKLFVKLLQGCSSQLVDKTNCWQACNKSVESTVLSTTLALQVVRTAPTAAIICTNLELMKGIMRNLDRRIKCTLYCLIVKLFFPHRLSFDMLTQSGSQCRLARSQGHNCIYREVTDLLTERGPPSFLYVFCQFILTYVLCMRTHVASSQTCIGILVCILSPTCKQLPIYCDAGH